MAERGLRRWPRTLAVLVFFALAYYMLLRWFEYRQVFQPYSTIQVDGRDLGRPWENVFFMAADGPRLNGWFFPAGAQSRRVRLVVLHCHGNGGNISHRLGDYEALLALGVNVFGFDYRGYGQSEGKPSEEGTYLDAQAAYRWLCQKGFGPTNIIVMGESLGGAVAAELALREKVGGLVLQSTFTSVPDLGAELFPWLPVRWFASIRYDTHAKLPRLQVPILIMHSRTDTLVRFHHAERNYAVANEPKVLGEISGDHNDTLASGRQRFIDGLERFLRVVEPDRSSETAKSPAPI